MIIIKTDITEQTITIIPRYFSDTVAFVLEDKEQEDNKVSIIASTTILNEFMSIPFTANFLKEGRKYFITVKDRITDVRIWQGEALCTDKTDLQNYNINE